MSEIKTCYHQYYYNYHGPPNYAKAIAGLRKSCLVYSPSSLHDVEGLAATDEQTTYTTSYKNNASCKIIVPIYVTRVTAARNTHDCVCLVSGFVVARMLQRSVRDLVRQHIERHNN